MAFETNVGVGEELAVSLQDMRPQDWCLRLENGEEVYGPDDTVISAARAAMARGETVMTLRKFPDSLKMHG